MNNIRKLAFIGGGNMAAALIGGLTKRGLASERVVVADPSQDQLGRLVRDYGVTTAADNATAVKGAEVVVLAVKPQQMRAVALGLAPHMSGTLPLVISVAAGIPHAALARWFGPSVPVIRTMPNRPALNGFGATGLAMENFGVPAASNSATCDDTTRSCAAGSTGGSLFGEAASCANPATAASGRLARSRSDWAG